MQLWGKDPPNDEGRRPQGVVGRPGKCADRQLLAAEAKVASVATLTVPTPVTSS
jgi:hypothetical protein